MGVFLWAGYLCSLETRNHRDQVRFQVLGSGFRFNGVGSAQRSGVMPGVGLRVTSETSLGFRFQGTFFFSVLGLGVWGFNPRTLRYQFRVQVLGLSLKVEGLGFEV